ncbi:MAG: Tim44 domain-containing protein [Rhodobacteraceae bacterium]|nr:Tim44 domain-containing protein [Paracoccaceae bacterium]
MTPTVIQLFVLAGIAVFLILRLRNTLGTREGYERPADQKRLDCGPPARDFEVIGDESGQDIADHVDQDSAAGKALAEMKRAEPGFSVNGFLSGSRQAYEIILMAFESGDLETLGKFLSRDVFDIFAEVVDERQGQGLTINTTFEGIRELTLKDATYDKASKEAEITIRFVCELTSVVKNADGEVVEGDSMKSKRQTDIWTFVRVMGSDDPNWKLVATGA